MHGQNKLNIKALNIVIFLMAIILVGWLLIIGRDLLIPLILALIIWYLLDTLAKGLQSFRLGNFGVSYPIALGCAFLVMIAAIILVINMVAANAVELAVQADDYEENIKTKLQGLIAMISPHFDFGLEQLSELLSPQKLVSWTTGVISSLASSLTLIIIYLLFLFLEQSVFEKKFSARFGDDEKLKKAHEIRTEIMTKIRVYLSVKTLVSVMTGLLSWGLLAWIGVDFAVFWGFIIFLLNYIPTIGSLLGVVFPAILSLVQFDSSWQFFVVVAVLGSAQFSIGNILEPRLMGSSLNLSGLVIMLALAIWGGIWGITGMILSVPITVVIMIICAQFPASRPFAVLLSGKGAV
jgi:predicted PurR-regulated permease PerM